jgi:ribosomal protein L11 methyltransferase
LQSFLFRIQELEPELLLAELYGHGTAGVIEESSGIRAFFPDDFDSAELALPYRSLIVESRHEAETAPADFERGDWEPILVGTKFFVAPSWVDAPTPSRRIRLTIDSTRAFGTGRHESTQLVIESMEQHLRPGSRVVDIGCGSGILSMAAAHLGANRVVSCDVDPEAVSTARQYLRSPVFQGSADAVRGGIADMVLANISTLVINSLAGELNRIVKPQGLLLLAGFIEGNVPTSFEPQVAYRKGDWLCWVCQPKASCSHTDNIDRAPQNTAWWD